MGYRKVFFKYFFSGNCTPLPQKLASPPEINELVKKKLLVFNLYFFLNIFIEFLIILLLNFGEELLLL